MQTPDEWLADFEAKVADLQQRATEFKTSVEAAGATERSADGSVSVTVAANGSLIDLRIEDAAMRKPGAELTAEIMALTRQARQSAANGVAKAFEPLGGHADAAQRIPQPDPTTATTDPAPKPPRDDDDDFADRVVVTDSDKW